MNEKPIIFSTEMVQAILEGRKSQTRRPVKLPKLQHGRQWIDEECFYADPGLGSGGYLKAYYCGGDMPVDDPVMKRIYCPYGQVGTKLWVRETFCPVNDADMGGEKWIDYKADHGRSHPAGWENEPDSPDALKWKPSIFMPREASRITLEITKIRVERLQEISTEDMKSEGFSQHPYIYYIEEDCPDFDEQEYREDFAEGWDKLYAKKGFGWDANPYVWVIEFRMVQPWQ